MRTSVDRVRRWLMRRFPHFGYVEVDGSIIPSPDLRWCGAEYRDDEFYIESAESEARRLMDRLGCAHGSRIIDIGCGQGRLPIGLLRVLPEVEYLGLDVDRRSIAWCEMHVEKYNSNFRFSHLDVFNERYNPDGYPLSDEFEFPVAQGAADAIYLFSVFTHTTEHDMRVYLKEFSRIAAEDCRIFFSAFVEEDVPDVSINPEGYRLRCAGPLHVVRYNRGYLFSVIGDYGFAVDEFEYDAETDGQSGLYLSRSDSSK